MSHGQDTVDVSRAEFGYMRERCVSIEILVAFKVGLTFKIDAVFVAEIVEVRVVGVVGGAHMVDVGTLHGHDLAFHLTA